MFINTPPINTKTPSLINDISNLISSVEGLVATGKFYHALALAWTVLVRRDESIYVQLTYSSIPYKLDKSQEDYDFSDLIYAHFELWPNFSKACELDPLLLLRYLSMRCKLPYIEGDELSIADPEHTYCGGTLLIKLDQAELALFKLRDVDAEVYVISSREILPPPPIVKKSVYCYAHTPGWVILHKHFQQGQSKRITSLQCSPRNFNIACAEIVVRNRIRICLAEFTHAPKFLEDPDAITGNPKLWVTIGLENEEQILNEALLHLKYAYDQKCDVLIFPELTITKKIRESIADWLFNNNVGDTNISWVVAGSFHEVDLNDGLVYNQASVIDGTGDFVAPFAHRKLTRVDLLHSKDSSLIEGIQTSELVTCVHTELGIQAVVICLDLAQGANEDHIELERLPLSWLWVPSLSRTVNPHIKQSKHIQLRQPCTVTCANQGPAQFRGHESGFAANLSFVVDRYGAVQNTWEMPLESSSSNCKIVELKL